MFGNGANEPDKPTWTNANWLKSRFHFSFAEYNDPSVSNFGVLRVLNDDLVQPSRGFGKHGHSNMEIVTYIVDGELSHKDSHGHAESLGRGSVQYMTSGKGVMHSEFNNHPEKPCRFLQLWIVPTHAGLPVNYGSLKGNAEARDNKWQHLASNAKDPSMNGEIKVNQDINIYVGDFVPGAESTEIAVGPGRQAYVVCVEGLQVGVEALALSGRKGKHGDGEVVAIETLDKHDAMEVVGPIVLRFKPGETRGHMMVVEMQQDGSSRFA